MPSSRAGDRGPSLVSLHMARPKQHTGSASFAASCIVRHVHGPRPVLRRKTMAGSSAGLGNTREMRGSCGEPGHRLNLWRRCGRGAWQGRGLGRTVAGISCRSPLALFAVVVVVVCWGRYRHRYRLLFFRFPTKDTYPRDFRSRTLQVQHSRVPSPASRQAGRRVSSFPFETHCQVGPGLVSIPPPLLLLPALELFPHGTGPLACDSGFLQVP